MRERVFLTGEDIHSVVSFDGMPAQARGGENTRSVERPARQHQALLAGLADRTHQHFAQIAARIEAYCRSQFGKSVIAILHVRQQKLAERRVPGLIHIDAGHHLGVWHQKAHQLRVGGRQ